MLRRQVQGRRSAARDGDGRWKTAKMELYRFCLQLPNGEH